jgi:superfamily II DNA/RNA helicase
LAEDDRKIVLFSEWTTMLGLIEERIDKHGVEYVRLDGSVPQKRRQALVQQFQNNPNCRLFVATNAGATGLNLQAANTVVNVDLPWNPAVLEQRIARAHRMGQKQPVQVFVLITEGTIEEGLLTTLSAKHDLALAALDADSDVEAVDLVSGSEELKSRLEVLLGAEPHAPLDESEKARQEAMAVNTARREQIALAGGELLRAAFSFVEQLLPPRGTPDRPPRLAETVKKRLAECMEQDEAGCMKLTVTLPDGRAVENLADSLARLLEVGA